MTTHFPTPPRSLLVLMLLGACGGAGKDDSASGIDTAATPAATPTVLSTQPLDDAADVPLNESVSATFSVVMNADSFDIAGAFTVTTGVPAVDVAGTVITTDSTAVFWPEQQFDAGTLYTATVTRVAMSAFGVPLAADHAWSFTTGDSAGPARPVSLGTANEFAILAKSGISSVPLSVITGDIGLSPAAATFITGFSLTADASDQFATSVQVTGNVYASDYAPPTPAFLTTAIGDMELAFIDAAGRAPDVTELGAGDIGGMDLAPGVYKWSSGLLIPTDATLSGSVTGVWIFEIAQDLTMSSGARVTLAGAKAHNVFWQVAGAVDLGTTAHLEGIVLTKKAVTVRTGATINGRLFAQTAVDLDACTVTAPAL
ncbi:MAG: hypothetical protein ACI8PZ_001161 [Myxococcota bacterium]|jgi:hypothetical protein